MHNDNNNDDNDNNDNATPKEIVEIDNNIQRREKRSIDTNYRKEVYTL
jgi:hypothetical protein